MLPDEKIQQKEDAINPFPDRQSELEYLQWEKEQVAKATTNLEAKIGNQPAASSAKPKVEQAPDRG